MRGNREGIRKRPVHPHLFLFSQLPSRSVFLRMQWTAFQNTKQASSTGTRPTFMRGSPSWACLNTNNRSEVPSCSPVAILTVNPYSSASEHNITGDVLCLLDADSLKEVGIATIGQRLAILKAVYQLKIANNIPIESDHYIPPCTFPWFVVRHPSDCFISGGRRSPRTAECRQTI